MASLCSARLLPSLSPDVLKKMSSSSSMHHDSRSLGCSSPRVHGFSSVRRPSLSNRRGNNRQLQVVAMAPEEEKLTRRNPLDFPIVSFPSIIFRIFPTVRNVTILCYILWLSYDGVLLTKLTLLLFVCDEYMKTRLGS